MIKGKIDRISYELGIMMYRAFTLWEVPGYDFLGNFLAIGRGLLDIVITEQLKEGFIRESVVDGVSEGKAEKLFRECYNDLVNLG